MIYKKKLAILSAITAALALAYILGIVFEPERRGDRAAFFSWMDPRTASQADTITVKKAEETMTLSLNNGKWFVSNNGTNYPAKQLRVADFLGLFSRRAPYPVRSNNAAAHERFGLDEASAVRVTVTGGTAPAFMDMLIGQGDITGQNVYMRKFGENEVRSGEDIFSLYLSSDNPAWYNLRLIPETEDGKLDVDQVQRLSVYPPDGASTQTFTRSGRDWTLAGEDPAELDMAKIDAYVRSILYAEGDDFADGVAVNAPELGDSRIVIELGSGEIKSIRFSAADANKRRMAAVSGAELVYSLPEWTAAQLFYEVDHFKKSGETETTETTTP